YAGKADGTSIRYIGRDSLTDWTTAESFAPTLQPGERLFVAAWDDGGAQMFIGNVRLPDGSLLFNTDGSWQWVRGPANSNPGSSLTALAQSASSVQTVATGTGWAAPAAIDANTDTNAPWQSALAGTFGGTPAQFIWSDSFSSDTFDGQFVLFRSPVYQPPAAP